LLRSALQRRAQAFDAATELPDDIAPLQATAAAVVIRRRPDLSGAVVPYRVWIDGKRTGTIRIGETKRFEVEPGHHRVGVGRRQPGDDRVWGVDLAAGEIGAFLCRSGFDGISLQISE
jgi:hypothetical protein